MSDCGVFRVTLSKFNGKPSDTKFSYTYCEVTRDQAARWAVEDYIREHVYLQKQLLPAKFTVTCLVEGTCGNITTHEVHAEAGYTVYIPYSTKEE
jgi:hypothetical protein